MKAYSANGFVCRDCYDPETIGPDEVFFEATPTDEELSAAFPNYAAIKAAQRLEWHKAARKYDYTQEADVLFFKAQRGECQLSDWLDKVAEIKQRYPY
jgi:hypothetical protein